MNASGRPNTCKSRGNMVAILMATGARVHNAYEIYPLHGDSPEKFGLIPNKLFRRHLLDKKDLSVMDDHAYD